MQTHRANNPFKNNTMGFFPFTISEPHRGQDSQYLLCCLIEKHSFFFNSFTWFYFYAWWFPNEMHCVYTQNYSIVFGQVTPFWEQSKSRKRRRERKMQPICNASYLHAFRYGKIFSVQRGKIDATKMQPIEDFWLHFTPILQLLAHFGEGKKKALTHQESGL